MIPARGGDVVRLFLTKTSVPNSSYPAVAATFVVELGFDVAMGSLMLLFAFTPGGVPQAARLRQAQRVRPLLPGPAPALHPVPADRAGGRRAGRLRAAERPRQGVLGAGAPGLHDPPRPRSLLPRGVRGAVRRLAVPLRRLLDAARGVQRRRLGEERAARARRQRGLGGGARSPRRALACSRRCWSRCSAAARSRARRSRPTRWASRSRSARSRSAIGFTALVFIFRVRSFKEVIARGREDRAAESGRPSPPGPAQPEV